MILLNSRLLCERMIDTKIYVNPSRVLSFGGSKSPMVRYYQKQFNGLVTRRIIGRVAHPLQPFIIPDRAMVAIEIEPIESNDEYLLMQDLIANLDAPEKSMWASLLCQEIARNGVARYKKLKFKDCSEVQVFLNSYMRPIIISIKEQGWQEELGDIGSGLISPLGELLKTGSGVHRFYICRILKLSRVPIRITGISSTYFHSHIQRPLTTRNLRMALSDIELRYA